MCVIKTTMINLLKVRFRLPMNVPFLHPRRRLRALVPGNEIISEQYPCLQIQENCMEKSSVPFMIILTDVGHMSTGTFTYF